MGWLCVDRTEGKSKQSIFYIHQGTRISQLIQIQNTDTDPIPSLYIHGPSSNQSLLSDPECCSRLSLLSLAPFPFLLASLLPCMSRVKS